MQHTYDVWDNKIGWVGFYNGLLSARAPDEKTASKYVRHTLLYVEEDSSEEQSVERRKGDKNQKPPFWDVSMFQHYQRSLNTWCCYLRPSIAYLTGAMYVPAYPDLSEANSRTIYARTHASRELRSFLSLVSTYV